MLFQIYRNLKQRLEHTPLLWLIKISIWCVVLFTVFIVLFKYTEGVSWEESLWQAWQTFTTVGYGNQPAETTAGRVVTMLISTLGIAFVGALFSAAFDYKQYLRELKKSGNMKNPYKNGYVIFNFPGTATILNFVRELRIVEKNVGICIVDSRLEHLPEPVAKLPNIHFVKGDTISRDTYEQAEIKENKAVIIFPIDSHASESDGATKVTVDLVSRFVSKANTRIIHVLVDNANAWMFEGVEATHVLSDLEILAIVQESQDPYSAEIIETLLQNTRGANPKTFKPTKIIGWTWGKLAMKCIEVSERTGVFCNLFALVQDKENMICPDFKTVIKEDALLSIIAYNDFSWETFENELMR